ncbi:unnamed protein product, partial [Iphiclides podalirius]
MKRSTDLFFLNGQVRLGKYHVLTEDRREVEVILSRFVWMSGKKGAFLNYTKAAMLAAVNDVNADDRECLTVLVTGNANSFVSPITILFVYKRISQEIADNFPSDWGIGKTQIRSIDLGSKRPIERGKGTSLSLSTLRERERDAQQSTGFLVDEFT